MLLKPFLFCLASSVFVALCAMLMFVLDGPAINLMVVAIGMAAMAIFSRFYSDEPSPIPLSMTEPDNTTNYSRK